MTERRGRTAAEWITFGVSCAILLTVVALIGAQALTESQPADPDAQVERVRVVGGRHHVEVEVTNHGTETAADVRVDAELVVAGDTTEVDQVIDFLAGGETEVVVFVFDDDPDDGELTVSVSSFSEP